MNDSIEQLKYLRLRALLAHWDEYLKWPPTKLSHARLLSMCGGGMPQTHNARRCGSKARIPEPLLIETFPFTAQAQQEKAHGAL
jgi:hypothetical protein